MVDDAREEKKEKSFFKSTAKKAGALAQEHKGFAAGGPTTFDRAKYGKNMAKIVNQTGRKAGRGR